MSTAANAPYAEKYIPFCGASARIAFAAGVLALSLANSRSPFSGSLITPCEMDCHTKRTIAPTSVPSTRVRRRMGPPGRVRGIVRRSVVWGKDSRGEERDGRQRKPKKKRTENNGPRRAGRKGRTENNGPKTTGAWGGPRRAELEGRTEKSGARRAGADRPDPNICLVLPSNPKNLRLLLWPIPILISSAAPSTSWFSRR